MKKTLITLAALALSAVANALPVTEEQMEDVESAMANQELSVGGSLTTGTKLKADDGGNIATNHAYTMMMVLDWDALARSSLAGWSTMRETGDILVAGWSDETWYKSGINLFKGDGGLICAGIMADNSGRKLLGNTTDSEKNTYGTISTTSTDVSNGNLNMGKGGYGITTNTGTKLVLTLTYDGTDTFTLSALKQTEDSEGNYTYTLETMTAEFDPGWSFVHYNTGAAQEIDTIAIQNMATDGVIEHVLAFNRALTADEILAVSVYVVPEPTTATLSLLALAGLAARRRRK